MSPSTCYHGPAKLLGWKYERARRGIALHCLRLMVLGKARFSIDHFGLD